MTDLVERLRDMTDPKRVGSHFHPLYGEAADRIEELEKALERIAYDAAVNQFQSNPENHPRYVARAALEERK